MVAETRAVASVDLHVEQLQETVDQIQGEVDRAILDRRTYALSREIKDWIRARWAFRTTLRTSGSIHDCAKEQSDFIEPNDPIKSTEFRLTHQTGINELRRLMRDGRDYAQSLTKLIDELEAVGLKPLEPNR